MDRIQRKNSIHLKIVNYGVLTVVQWVKNLTAVAWVTAEAQVGVRTLAQCSGLKDLALPQL